jgi:hypothetical protein
MYGGGGALPDLPLKDQPKDSLHLMGRTLFMGGLAVVLFVPLFITRGIGVLDFWWWLSANILILVGLSVALDGRMRRAIAADVQTGVLRKVVVGLLSAGILYFVFYAGNVVSRMIFPFAAGGIENVYAFKTQASPVRIVLLMAFLIGPGEEIFWRGFLQRRLGEAYGPLRGFFFAAALYALVHAGSLNPMLLIAAAVCGLFWGWLYYREQSLLLNVISHTAWDLMIFVVAPVA